MLIERTSISGFNLFNFSDVAEAARYITQTKAISVSVNAEVLINDADSIKAIVNSGIGYADGIGAVLGAKACGHSSIKKIAGVELWLEVLRSYGKGSVYLIGAKPDVVKQVAQRLANEYPLLRIVGVSDGYFTEEEFEEIQNDIVAQRPDIIVIATGQPRQELLAKRIFERHPAIFLCVGGAFDVYAGYAKRAPQWLITLGLEWFYRLVQEPTRFKRYMKLLHLFPLLVRMRLHRDGYVNFANKPSDSSLP
jgi:UDP-N-acetyl-D-mannosaminouronate:lipid I N-acetyl-D-mannosaminouronosyltransferase